MAYLTNEPFLLNVIKREGGLGSMFKLITIPLGVLLLTGCIEYETNLKEYQTEQSAVIAWYKSNIKVIKGLNETQELLGWVVKCGDFYRNTSYVVGGVSNPLREREVSKPRGCTVVANIHTHPIPLRGMTSDFFSGDDLSASKFWNMYLLSQESCKVRRVRRGKGVNSQYGEVLGYVKGCK